MRLLPTTFACAFLTAAALPAVADEASLSSGAAPAFSTMDRGDGASRAGVSLGFNFFDDESIQTDVALRTDVYGQYVLPNHFGVYGSLPISYISGGDESSSAIGNAEIGGLYILQTGRAPILRFRTIALRAGLGLPTAADDFEGLLVNAFNIAPRLTDLVSITPDTTWLRLSASPTVREGKIFVRADAGIDIAVSAPEDAEIDPIVHMNVGAGYDAGKFALMGEVVTVATTGEVDENDERFFHTGALTARYTAADIQPGVSFVTPLDDAGLGEQWALMFDVQYVLPLASR